ncbi:MAG: transglutaminase domain-containing protein [Deltaproteobacteria bacterium]|nr:transglutaminase domain-containing protein [Deltaproteobacteria bacterium]
MGLPPLPNLVMVLGRPRAARPRGLLFLGAGLVSSSLACPEPPRERTPQAEVRASDPPRPGPVAPVIPVNAVAGVAPVAPVAPPALDGYRHHTFYDYHFHGKKVGYLEARDEPTTYEGQRAILSVRRTVITVKRDTSLIKMVSDIESWSTPEGVPLAFKHLRDEGSAIRTLSGKKVGATFEIETNVAGGKTKSSVPLTRPTYLNAAYDALTKPAFMPCAPRPAEASPADAGASPPPRAPKAKCPEVKGRTIVEEDGSVGGFRVALSGTEEYRGRPLMVLTGTLSVGGTQLTTKEWVDAEGVPQRIVFVELGAELTVASEAEALRMEFIDDIFTRGRLSSGVNLPKPSDHLAALEVELIATAGAPPNPVADVTQTVRRISADRVSLRVRRVSAPTKSEPLTQAPSAEGSRWLAKTPYEQLDDPKIIAAAKQATAGAKTKWDAAKAIIAFVYRHIEKKSLAQAFSSAVEALDAREGDCTEHAVLASALAKALGIPARIATGLVYVGGPDGGFGYHAWVEFLIGGAWIPMDPTFNQELADPSHLKFTRGSSDPEGLREAGVAAAALFGNIELKVVEFETLRGERKRLAEPK